MANVRTCISQTLPALPTTLLILIPIEPMPVAMAAAVVLAVVAVLLNVLVAVDETDMAVALVEVSSVVAVELIIIPDMPDIVPMSIPDISMLSLLLEFRNEWKVGLQIIGVMVRRLSSSTRGELSVKSGGQVGLDLGLGGSGPSRPALVPSNKGRRWISWPRSGVERTFWTGPDESTEI